MKTRSKMDMLFIAFAIGVFGAGCGHLAAAIEPSIIPDQSLAEHVFWVIADWSACYFIVNRTSRFVPVLVIWSIQQWYFHGGAALTAWQVDERFAVSDIVVVIFMTVMPVLYFIDQKGVFSKAAE